jgi:uncharacterized protein (UPF0305 family)
MRRSFLSYWRYKKNRENYSQPMPTLVLFYNKKWYSIYIGNRDYLTNLKIKGGIEMSVVTTVQKEIESLKNSIKREKAIESNIFDMTAVIEHIAELKEASEPMAEESPYESYEEWQAAAEKELKGYQSSLTTIAENKEILVALETYISEHPEGV